MKQLLMYILPIIFILTITEILRQYCLSIHKVWPMITWGLIVVFGLGYLRWGRR